MKNYTGRCAIDNYFIEEDEIFETFRVSLNQSVSVGQCQPVSLRQWMLVTHSQSFCHNKSKAVSLADHLHLVSVADSQCQLVSLSRSI